MRPALVAIVLCFLAVSANTSSILNTLKAKGFMGIDLASHAPATGNAITNALGPAGAPKPATGNAVTNALGPAPAPKPATGNAFTNALGPAGAPKPATGNAVTNALGPAPAPKPATGNAFTHALGPAPAPQPATGNAFNNAQNQYNQNNAFNNAQNQYYSQLWAPVNRLPERPQVLSPSNYPAGPRSFIAQKCMEYAKDVNRIFPVFELYNNVIRGIPVSSIASVSQDILKDSKAVYNQGCINWANYVCTRFTVNIQVAAQANKAIIEQERHNTCDDYWR